MKKMYVTPQVEVVKITQCVTLLNGSGPEASAAVCIQPLLGYNP